jgi:hypothetical protein
MIHSDTPVMQSAVTSWQLPVGSWQLPVASCQLPVTGFTIHGSSRSIVHAVERVVCFEERLAP